MFMTRLKELVSHGDEARAEVSFGVDHTLVRLLGLRRSLLVQVAVTALALLFGVVGSFRHVLLAPLELGAACFVALVLAGGFVFVRRHLRSQAQELIASGYQGLGVGIVDQERRRLLSRSERERAARWLEGLLRDSQRWTTSPSARPLPELRCFRFVGAEISEIVALLRSSSVNVAGVARTMRFLEGGSDSVLLSGDVERLRHRAPAHPRSPRRNGASRGARAARRLALQGQGAARSAASPRT